MLDTFFQVANTFLEGIIEMLFSFLMIPFQIFTDVLQSLFG